MDLVTDFTESNKGNKHILTIIDLLMGWLEAIPIPNKSADTITKAFIRHYLPRHLCPQFILLDNSTEFKNQTFNRVTKDLSIERIFSAPYHPQSNGKLETFHKFLKPTLKKMCAEDQDNWDDYVKQVLRTYRGVPNPTKGESPFFLVYGRDGNQPLHQVLQPLTRFLGNPDLGLLCLNRHQLSLSIAKKYLDNHRFLTAEKTINEPLQPLQVELDNLHSLFMAYKPVFSSAMSILQTQPSFDGKPIPPSGRKKQSLLPFLGSALKWLTGTAPTKDIKHIRNESHLLSKPRKTNGKQWYTLFPF